MNRLDALDWQRGFLALSVMFYHLCSAYITPLDSSFLLGRLGIYAVSMFFVLSGLSMALVYREYLTNISSSVKFFIRRVFRILPLLWLAIGLVIFVLGKEVSFEKIVLNATLLFSFIDRGEYINSGAWSIGNEMVYYALTPMIIIIYNRSVMYGNALLFLSILVGLWFSHYALDAKVSLSSQWLVYINPLNNLFFYVSGIAIVYNFRAVKFKSVNIALMLFMSFLFFLFYPAGGDQINIATGNSRVVFSIASILMVLAVYKTALEIPKAMNYIFTSVGLATYSIYLLHPIINGIVHIKIKEGSVSSGFEYVISVALLTILISMIVYHFLEKPFIKLGRLVTR